MNHTRTTSRSLLGGRARRSKVRRSPRRKKKVVSQKHGPFATRRIEGERVKQTPKPAHRETTQRELEDNVLMETAAQGIGVSRSGLHKFVGKLKHLLSHTTFTARLGGLGKNYQDADSDLRDAWRAVSLLQANGHSVQLSVPEGVEEDLSDVVASTARAVVKELDAHGPKFRGTILHALPRVRDMKILEEKMEILQHQMQVFNRAVSTRQGGDGGEDTAPAAVDWHEVVSAIGTISRIGKKAITKRNTRIHTHGDTVLAESIAVGIALRVSMITCLKLFHIVRELGGGARHSEGASASVPLPPPSTLISPLGNVYQDERMEASMRLMMHLAFRGGFGGVGWIFPGDATIREAASLATERRIMPRIRRHLRRARKWMTSPMIHTISTLLIWGIMQILPLGSIISNPVVLQAVSMVISVFLGNVVRKALRSVAGTA